MKQDCGSRFITQHIQPVVEQHHSQMVDVMGMAYAISRSGGKATRAKGKRAKND
jgi:hypothetical protein